MGCVPHPGEILREEFLAGNDGAAPSQAIHMRATHVNDIVTSK